MPGIVHVKVVKARDLPVMDKRSELTDAFVEVGRSVSFVVVFSTISAQRCGPLECECD